MLNLKEFEIFKLENRNQIKGGDYTVKVIGSSSYNGATTHDMQQDGGSSGTACGVPDDTQMGDVIWT